MAPSAIADHQEETFSGPKLGLTLPQNAVERLKGSGIDPDSYPTRPQKPDFLDEVFAVRNKHRYALYIPHKHSIAGTYLCIWLKLC